MADKVDITFLEPSADVSVVQIEAETAYQLVNGSITWVEAQATEVVLDPDTKNRYFRDEAFSLSEQASLHPQKVTLDSFGFSDQQIFDVTKGIADQLSFSDVVDILLIIERDFSDAYTLAELLQMHSRLMMRRLSMRLLKTPAPQRRTYLALRIYRHSQLKSRLLTVPRLLTVFRFRSIYLRVTQ